MQMLKPFSWALLPSKLLLLSFVVVSTIVVATTHHFVQANAVKTVAGTTHKLAPPLLPKPISSLNFGLYQSFQLTHQRAVETVYHKAMETITKAQAKTEKIGWVVLDLDETVLDNRAYFIAYGDYQPDQWLVWALQGEAPAVAGSLQFIRFLQANQLPFAFLSGRREAQRAATLKNLMLLGVPTTVPILLKPNTYPEDKTAVVLKQEARCGLEAQSGVAVWMLIGDQSSDLQGDCRGNFQFKLPNPIYTIE
jgi:predicted secreted acid phosphatase